MGIEMSVVGHAQGIKMRNQVLRRIYDALTDLDSEIDDGDTEPAFAGATAIADPDRGLIQIKVNDRRFDIIVVPHFR